MENGQSPLVLHYTGCHYSAFIHQRDPLSTIDCGLSSMLRTHHADDGPLSDVSMKNVEEVQTERLQSHM